MDCLTFRRQMLEDPGRRDNALREHERSCSRCAAFARSLRADEAKLHEALTVAPPAELAERIQLAISFGEVKKRRPQRPWLSIAAAGLLAVAAGTLGWLTYFHKPYEDLSLERSVLNHVQDEARHLYDPGPALASEINGVFERFGAKVSEQALGDVNFAGICMMRRNRGVHLVLRGEMGPVTVFFMPGEKTRKPMALDSERFAGMIEPTDWGSIAVVGEQGEPLMPVLERVRQAVTWPAERISAAWLRDYSQFS
jgi:hypothetical protein